MFKICELRTVILWYELNPRVRCAFCNVSYQPLKPFLKGIQAIFHTSFSFLFLYNMNCISVDTKTYFPWIIFANLSNLWLGTLLFHLNFFWKLINFLVGSLTIENRFWIVGGGGGRQVYRNRRTTFEGLLALMTSQSLQLYMASYREPIYPSEHEGS